MMAQSNPPERGDAFGGPVRPTVRKRVSPEAALKTAFARDPRFVVCVVALGVGLGSVEWLRAYGFRFSKQRVDLKAPLESMDAKKILPYRLVGSDTIPKEEVEALGTEEYVRWRLEDMSVRNVNDPLHWPTLFVTYYSGQPDQVPHVPEECFLGGGYEQLSSRDAKVKVPGLEPATGEVPVRILKFRKDSTIGGALVPTVIYLFSVNGEFVGSRTAVRLALSNPFEQYGYFSKVEVSFSQRPGGGSHDDAVLRAAERLLGKVLPVLVRDHWPDWPPEGPPVGS